MSIRAMTQVWESFPRGGSDMLVVLALADWCNDAGLSLHPSIHAIAEKCRLSDWQARRIVHQLIEEGLLEVIGNEFGGAPGMSRQYRFRLDRLTAGTHATPSAADATRTPGIDATPGTGDRAGTHARDGWHPCTQTPSTGASLTVIEPPIDVSTKTATPSCTLAKKKSTPAKNKKSIPADFSVSAAVRVWAQKKGFGDLDAHLESFVSKAQANGYRYVDWDAAFKNAIRDDWAGLRGRRRGSPADDRFAEAL